MSGSIRNSANALKALISTNVTTLQRRVYVWGDQESVMMPRCKILPTTPVDNFAGLGTLTGSNAGLPIWKASQYKIDIWSKNPIDCDTVASQIEDVIRKNAVYDTATTRSTYGGGFYLLRLNGGTETQLHEKSNHYHRIMLVVGRWLQVADV